jgi:hypothetical protein
VSRRAADLVSWEAPEAPRRAGPVYVMLVYAGLLGAVVFAAVAVAGGSRLLIAAAVTGPVLGLLTLPIARRIARLDGDPGLVAVVMAAFAAKMFGSVLRYYVAFNVYGGVADANQYHAYGRWLMPYYRRADFSPELGPIIGTGWIRALSGGIYAITGPSKLAAFMVFGFLAFCGTLLFWRAFRSAVPDGDAVRYRTLVLFLPSLVYWPASMGKEAWVILGLGVTAYGAAVVLRQQLLGYLWVAAGLGAITLVRPHVALVAFVALAAAELVRKTRRTSTITPVLRAVSLVVLVVIGGFLVGRAEQFFGVSSLTEETIGATLTTAGERTETGGSAFRAVRVRTPLDFPFAAVTVLYRPFPFEVENLQGLLTSLEGVVLAVVTLASLRRLASIPHHLRRFPYVAFSLVFVAVFIWAFSAFSNFGILARQRVQVLPFLLVLVSLPLRPRGGFPPDGPDEPAEAAPDERDRLPGAAFLDPRAPLDSRVGATAPGAAEAKPGARPERSEVPAPSGPGRGGP